MAYFDNAATTFPKPDEVYSYMTNFYEKNGVNVGRGKYDMARTSGAIVNETRELVMRVLKCESKQVIFEPTATISLNIIIQGLIKKGIHNIYISPFEHNAVTRTLHNYEESQSISVTKLFVTNNLMFDLERIRLQFDEKTPDLVIVSHASNVTGLISPIEEIFSLAKEYNALTLVDMAQTSGLVDTNVGSEDIDFAVFAGHKTLYGPTGISGFVMKPGFQLPAVLFGGTGFDSANQNMPNSLPERFEMGTLNIVGIAGLYAAIKWILNIGLEKIWEKEQQHRSRLISILEEHDCIDIIGNYPGREYVGIVSCLIMGISSDSAGEVFNRLGIAVRTGLQCAPLAHQFLETYPAGTVRFSTSYFTQEKDFEELDKALTYIDESI